MIRSRERITAPLRNIHWRQCSRASAKGYLGGGNFQDEFWPPLRRPLQGNTIKEENYIEEGYLPGWEEVSFLAGWTRNRTLDYIY